MPSEFSTEVWHIEDLRPHPRNYRDHPDGQIEHLMASIREHGMYRNIVIARDGTILGGHGVVKAARKLGLGVVWVRRLDLDPNDPRAIKILVGDNEIAQLADIDDRALTEMLKELKDQDEAMLLGTGYDPLTLAALAFTTRPAAELKSIDEAAEWAGMPEFEPGEKPLQIVLNFASEEDRQRCVAQLGIAFSEKSKSGYWWPPRERREIKSQMIEG